MEQQEILDQTNENPDSKKRPLATINMEMNKKTKTIIGVLIIWNIVLSGFIFLDMRLGLKTSNQVRNIYNKTTTITFEELNEEGVRWGHRGGDIKGTWK